MERKPHDLQLSLVPSQLKIAESIGDFEAISKVRAQQYGIYPSVTHNQDDTYDKNACVLYSQNSQGEVTSTGRIVFDSPLGLPADQLIKAEIDKLRQQGLVVAESSKFAITREARGILPAYFYTYYEIAAAYGIDSLIFIIRNKNVGLYQKTAGAQVLVDDIGYQYGTHYRFSLLECRVQVVIPTFLKFWGDI